jgi:acid phosphatase
LTGNAPEHATRNAQSRTGNIRFMVESLTIAQHANLNGRLLASGESVTQLKSSIIVALTAALAACAASPDKQTAKPDHAILWAAHSVEYQAISAQVYAQATRDIPRLLADTSWSAVPGFEGNELKPPAVILDVDETILSGTDLELTMLPFSTQLQYEWALDHKAIPIRGVVDFVAAARSAGIEVFILTNRPCEKYKGTIGKCPIEDVTIQDLKEIGINVDAEHALFANEKPGWDREKVVRREFIAASHRVIMVFGDDFGDFVACSRGAPKAPCTTPATRASRADDLDKYNEYWGNGWYILPNPMYGSWTSVE